MKITKTLIAKKRKFVLVSLRRNPDVTDAELQRRLEARFSQRINTPTLKVLRKALAKAQKKNIGFPSEPIDLDAIVTKLGRKVVVARRKAMTQPPTNTDTNGPDTNGPGSDGTRFASIEDLIADEGESRSSSTC